ncbi:restriction endonuclease subunit S [Helicobacter suis]|uniref:restriction endonuclease subunit S n=2 Tax=Helicobacter suis TaxID=104628 RepID=UPI001F2B7958|nr:restriction endonuclease subunit S [Helicobacter suis]
MRQQAHKELEKAKLEVERACAGGGGNIPLKCGLKKRLTPIKSLLKQARLAYRYAEWVLLETLLTHTPKNYTIKTFKESFLKTRRLDAQYYQEKYTHNENLIKSHPHARLKDLVRIKKSIEPGSDAYKSVGVPFVRVSNLSPFDLSASTIFLDPKRDLESLYPKQNEVLFSKDGSIGIAYCVPQDLKVVLSSAILRLEIKDCNIISPHYLSLVLNSQVVKLQVERESIGSVIAHLKLSKISNLLIPLLDQQIQQNIEIKLKKSADLRTQSFKLLKRAKTEVERQLTHQIKHSSHT